MEKLTFREFRARLSHYIEEIGKGSAYTVNGVHIGKREESAYTVGEKASGREDSAYTVGEKGGTAYTPIIETKKGVEEKADQIHAPTDRHNFLDRY